MVISTMSKKTKNNVSVTKIKNFLEEKSNNLPVVSINGAHVKVGKYYCLERNGVWEVYDNGTLINSFTLRKSALAWAVASLQGQTTDSQQVEAYDMKFNRYSNDSYLFHERYKTATDDFRKELMYIRWEESEYHKNSIRDRLDESIKKIQIN